MNSELTLENFISGDVFRYGINGTILKPFVKTGDQRTFLVLFNSVDKKVVAASKELGSNELVFASDINKNGGQLTINTIPPNDTICTLGPDENSAVDGFALVRTSNTTEIESDGTKTFPNLEGPYDIMIKGKLNNNPVFSADTKFQFNKSTVSFNVSISEI